MDNTDNVCQFCFTTNRREPSASSFSIQYRRQANADRLRDRFVGMVFWRRILPRRPDLRLGRALLQIPICRIRRAVRNQR